MKKSLRKTKEKIKIKKYPTMYAHGYANGMSMFNNLKSVNLTSKVKVYDYGSQ